MTLLSSDRYLIFLGEMYFVDTGRTYSVIGKLLFDTKIARILNVSLFSGCETIKLDNFPIKLILNMKSKGTESSLNL